MFLRKQELASRIHGMNVIINNKQILIIFWTFFNGSFIGQLTSQINYN